MNTSPWYKIQNEAEVASPAVLIFPDRIRENLLRMIALVGDVQKLRPHVKTHKLPQVIAMKRELGIDKFKAATIAEAEMTAMAGGRDVLLAYPLVGPNIHRFLRLQETYPQTKFSALVDNESTLHQIAKAAVAANTTIRLYLDLNVGMHRTGIVVGTAALKLYQNLCQTEGIQAAGLHAYDGHIHESTMIALQEEADLAFGPVWNFVAQLRAEGFAVPSLVVSGTPTSKLLASHSDVEVGAGTIALWDFGQPLLSPDLDFLHAAVIFARVVSRPTGTRLCIDLGHKAIASEMDHPRVQFFGLEDALPVMHSEEHLVLESARAAEYPVGTVLYGLPKHVCPTIALHNEVIAVQSGVATDPWHVLARDRRITI